MKQKRRGSIRVRIMLPVVILGIAAVLSNFAAISNIQKVNSNASRYGKPYGIKRDTGDDTRNP